MSSINKIMLLVTLSIAALTFSFTANASEGGGSSYPNGAESIMAGAIPPPGFYFINYTNYYTADKMIDNDGDEQHVNLDLKVKANVFRFIYITDKQFLGGFIGFHTLIPLMDMDLDIMGMDDDDSGLGDITIGTNLSWHTKNWNFAAGLDITAPTGQYDKDELVNVGRNYYSIEPVLGFTYLSDGGYEASVKAMYDFNTENNDTDYQTGQEFHFDYHTGYHIGNWVAGISGYYYKQVTDDEQNGHTVDNYKGQVLAIGPALKYQYKNMSFIAKYQKETMVRNRTEGEKYWVKFIYAF
ncbi:conserved hypothetical protein [Denitrovibrio acetiphilus DSM 12809]|uniref:Uncharacterized protein n=1 Tax=Denitrovibrio acetiphilus (strain DSM 12809 / NBRC 114555 / N2460) TaxID=522772 RepID=D4H8K0_DENA2|nr:transporter [Denitrovibrio acetiphilus]ADD68349.1 conserved hypothetical protein [Denitrovibrio acetiphilus DSM 12809]